MNTAADYTARAAAFVAGCVEVRKAYIVRNGFGPHVMNPELAVQSGKRYDRIVCLNTAGQPESVYCFVDRTNGNVLKSAGWKTPAKHARGNIFRDDTGLASMGPHGAAYMR